MLSLTHMRGDFSDNANGPVPTTAEPDGLPIPDVGRWAETKYRLVSLYDRLFSTGIKAKWDARVYIDLFAGAGYARLRGTDRIVFGSPLLALDLPDQFDKYIFCEADSELIGALEQRVRRHFPQADATFIHGDCNETVEQVLAAITGTRVLSLCFVDPPDIGIEFSTVRKLSSRRMDFLVLLALYMDANRNETHYASASNPKVDNFLGNTAWRERWESERKLNTPFGRFLATEYSKQMEVIGHLPVPTYKMKEVRSDEKNLPLYHLALFSKHELAYRFWDEVLKYSTDQMGFGY